MFGKNPKRKPINGDGTYLEVQEIFSSIQGEGPNSGMPAVFVRLGGCNLACHFCDTEFESSSKQSLDTILEEVKLLSDDVVGLVVVTGGEPLRQPIEKLCKKLLDLGFMVQIETNGTLYRDLPNKVNIVCSPKNSGNGYKKLRPDLLGSVKAMKFVVSAKDNLYRDVVDVGQGKFGIPVYVQPMDEMDDEKNIKNVKHAIQLAKKNGYHLSIQQHKILGLP